MSERRSLIHITRGLWRMSPRPMLIVIEASTPSLVSVFPVNGPFIIESNLRLELISSSSSSLTSMFNVILPGLSRIRHVPIGSRSSSSTAGASGAVSSTTSADCSTGVSATTSSSLVELPVNSEWSRRELTGHVLLRPKQRLIRGKCKIEQVS